MHSHSPDVSFQPQLIMCFMCLKLNVIEQVFHCDVLFLQPFGDTLLFVQLLSKLLIFFFALGELAPHVQSAGLKQTRPASSSTLEHTATLKMC